MTDDAQQSEPGAEHGDADISAFLLARYGPTITGLLYTRRSRATAWRVHERIAERGGDSLARCWMIGLNPHLDDTPPILAIAAGRFDDAEAAAKAYEEGAFA